MHFLSLVSVEDKMKIYFEFQEKFPRAQTPQRRPLDFTSGNELFSYLYLYFEEVLVYLYELIIENNYREARRIIEQI